MAAVITGGIPASRSSTYLQSLQGHLQWIMGANMPGKCMTEHLGVRSTNCLLHEDTNAMGLPNPPGIIPFGYTAWAAGGIQAFQGVGVNSDGQLTFLADNVTGANEGLVQPGSTKTWNNWRFGESYWEYDPECRGMITISEYQLAPMTGIVACSLYCHGWDGNV
jgi:hypothetical protein